MRKFIGDIKAAAAIEMAFILPIFALLTLALVEVGIVYFSSTQMYHAATDVSKSIRRGDYTTYNAASGTWTTQAAGVATARIMSIVEAKSSGFLSATKSDSLGPLMVVSVSKITSNSTADNNRGEPCYDPAGTRYSGAPCKNPVTNQPYPFKDLNGDGVWDKTPRNLVKLTGFPDANAGDIIEVSISYRWKIMTPIVSAFFTNGTVNIQSSVLVKNEAF